MHFRDPLGLYQLPLESQLAVLALHEDSAPAGTPSPPPASAGPPPPGWSVDAWSALNENRVA